MTSEECACRKEKAKFCKQYKIRHISMCFKFCNKYKMVLAVRVLSFAGMRQFV